MEERKTQTRNRLRNHEETIDTKCPNFLPNVRVVLTLNDLNLHQITGIHNSFIVGAQELSIILILSGTSDAVNQRLELESCQIQIL